jgi:AcrR family transcriptional regulator
VGTAPGRIGRVTSPAPSPRRGPGRPRSPQADAAILRAALSVLAEDGWPGFTVEKVAARAGVAKTTLYRRWSSRADLAVGAVAALVSSGLAVAPAASAEQDVRDTVRAVAEVIGTPGGRAAYLAVMAEAARDVPLRARVEREILAPVRATVAAGIARAQARGEAPADVDVDLVHDLLSGPLLHRLLVREAEVDDAFVDTLAAIALVAVNQNAPS